MTHSSGVVPPGGSGIARAREQIGRRWGPYKYEVGREAIHTYSEVVGETNAVYYDRSAARLAGFPDIVAPPMFVAVYSLPALETALLGLDLDLPMLLHSRQEFEWGQTVHAGDVISTTVCLSDVLPRRGLDYLMFEAISVNQAGLLTARGLWTHLVRQREGRR